MARTMQVSRSARTIALKKKEGGVAAGRPKRAAAIAANAAIVKLGPAGRAEERAANAARREAEEVARAARRAAEAARRASLAILLAERDRARRAEDERRWRAEAEARAEEHEANVRRERMEQELKNAEKEKKVRASITGVPRTGKYGACTICGDDEVIDPVGCILCENFIGCRRCVARWFKESKTMVRLSPIGYLPVNIVMKSACPLCRAEWVKKPAVRPQLHFVKKEK